MPRLTVACCLWGHWPTAQWGPEYVNRLYRGVQRHLTIPHKFVCLTDTPEGIDPAVEIKPLNPVSRMDILPKLCVYRPGTFDTERIVVVDLDTVITGNLDEMFSYDGPFAVRHEFVVGRQHMIGGDMLGFPNGFGEDLIWKPLNEQTKFVEDSTHGDERVAYQMLLLGHVRIDFWQDLYPGQFVSYKRHVRSQKKINPVGGRARMVSFHGKPRPHECLKIRWIREAWV